MAEARWRLVDMHPRDGATRKGTATSVHGKGPQAGYISLTCWQRATRAEEQEAAATGTHNLQVGAVVPKTSQANVSVGMKFEGEATRLGAHGRRARRTKSTSLAVLTAQFEGLAEGLGTRRWPRGPRPSRAWPRETPISPFLWLTTRRGSTDAVGGSRWLRTSPPPPTAWPR
jgi:hypothetical protein